jgi:hypothetical protein
MSGLQTIGGNVRVVNFELFGIRRTKVLLWRLFIVKIWNKRDPNTPQDAIYVGRPTKFGNPYSHLPNTKALHRVKNRSEAIRQYRIYLQHQPELIEAAKRELRGKDLVCWCAPAECHATVLMEVANE